MRKLTRMEFVERMLADRALQDDERKRKEREVIYGYIAARDYRIKHRIDMRAKQRRRKIKG